MGILQYFFAVLLLPLVFSLIWNFFSVVTNLAKNVSTGALPFWMGIGSYFLFQVIFFKPLRTYVFGHELTHALVGLISGARLKSFKVSASGGSVVLTKTNVWIALAPYFVPLYTIFVIAGYHIGTYFWPLINIYPYYLFAVGFTLSFHFSLTHFAISQGQKDLRHFGVFFSFVLIVAVNIIFLILILKLLFPEGIWLKGFFVSSGKKTIFIWQIIYEKARRLCGLFR